MNHAADGDRFLRVHILQITESLSLAMPLASGAHSVRVLIRQVRIGDLALTAPGRSVGLAVDDDGVVGCEHVQAQVTAWSERRSHGGASVVVIIGVPLGAGWWS